MASPSEGFVKHDSGKPRWSLLPMDAVTEVVRVLTFGAKKYSDHNWCNGPAWSRYYDAAMRHMAAFWLKEDGDQETGISHLAHAACCVLILLALQLRGLGKDDRP